MAGTFQDRSAAITTASIELAPAVAKRTMLIIANTHATQTLWINLAGGTAAANTAGNILIPALTSLKFEGEDRVPRGKITGIASGAATGVTVQSIE